jgi:hypothetical protein
MKLATFVVTEVIYQNVKKKVTKIIPRRRGYGCGYKRARKLACAEYGRDAA